MANLTSPSLVTSLWAQLLTQHPYIAEGPVGILLVHEVVYFGVYLPFLIADYIPSLRKYKIQPNEQNNGWQLWRCLRWVLFLHFCIEFPLMVIAHPLFKYLGIRSSLPLPLWSTVAWQCALSFVIEDFYFYWVHRFLHWNAIYKYIHKQHHLHAAPFGMAAEYAHPIETVFLGVGSVLGPIIFAYTHGMHLVTLYIWLAIRLLQTVEVHSGYNFPWSTNRWMPLWGGAEFHDFHHMTFSSNFSSTFTLWDWVFGTSAAFYELKKKQLTSKQKKLL